MLKLARVAFSIQDPLKLLLLSTENKNLKIGKIVHALLIVSRPTSEENTYEANSLINFYSKCCEVWNARNLFDRMRDRNVVSWGALMAGYLHHGLSLEVIVLLKDMLLEGSVRPNEYIFATVISSCSDGIGGRVDDGRQCHGFVLKSGLLFHQYVRNALVYMYSKCSRIQDALSVCNSFPGNDIFAYNSVLRGLVEHGYLTEGLEILRRMLGEYMKWDSVAFVNAFGLCASLKDLKLGLQVHGKMMASDVESDVYINSATINMYGKCGKVSSARRVFDRLQSQNVILWTAIMSVYLQNGCFEETLNLFSEMLQEDVKPNEYTFAVLLNASAGLSTLKHGYLLHARTLKSGFTDYNIVGNSLIDVYAKGGNIEAANKVFSNMIYRDTISWNAIICGYSHHGLGKEALLVFQDMLAAEEHPNHVTFVGVLSACAHLGIVQEGLYYFNHLMKQVGVDQGLQHYTCVVGLLSKAGQLHEAQNFMISSPVRWDAVAWRTLLNACHVHRNYDLGKQIAEHVLEMYPSDVGSYTLLSNMFAKAERWDNVVKIRKLMRERNIKKEPGVSWIEIKNATHIFVSEDSKHPEHTQIYEKVKELLSMIRPLGYVPDIGAVLHDVEDEQKEYYLSYHSEKLAVAYGIMKMPAATPILVMKNLRMCDDCHSAIKLISKVTNRMIIVRDAKRFHHFQDGHCTCADYW
ncbi:hypothetical protein K2173_020176 [Erythroxylum novogranatense]|uniref:DYW domain-containing protein n=1 Tax=Erythroxylum novogranatense TaxID=1862640 RepID=A0AAV8U751_9ROSI|nr:hypothetical protein K2173_020176 [Erythroxylum novogranatense]